MQTSLSSALAQVLLRLAPVTPTKPVGFSPDQSHPGDTHAHSKRAAGDFFDSEALSDPKRLPTSGPVRRGMIVDILV